MNGCYANYFVIKVFIVIVSYLIIKVYKNYNMLLPYFSLLSTKNIILGSQSTSRNSLMKTQVTLSSQSSQNTKLFPAHLLKTLTNLHFLPQKTTMSQHAKEKFKTSSTNSRTRISSGIFWFVVIQLSSTKEALLRSQYCINNSVK